MNKIPLFRNVDDVEETCEEMRKEGLVEKYWDNKHQAWKCKLTRKGEAGMTPHEQLAEIEKTFALIEKESQFCTQCFRTTMCIQHVRRSEKLHSKKDGIVETLAWVKEELKNVLSEERYNAYGIARKLDMFVREKL